MHLEARRKISICAVAAFAATLAATCGAGIAPESPKEGEVVSQLWPEQKEFLETPIERRISAARTDAEAGDRGGGVFAPGQQEELPNCVPLHRRH